MPADTQPRNSKQGGRRTRAAIAAQTREAILNAACDVIAETGFENIRMRMVAERAGVSTAALHYHFDTRDQLFAAALHYSFGSTGADVYEARGDDDTATARLVRIINASLPMTVSLRREWALWQELWCRAGRDRESRTLAVDLYKAHTGWIEETLDDGIASGEFQPCDTAAHAQLINALCDGFGVQLMIGTPAVTLDSARAAIWALATEPLGVTTSFPEDRRR
ncbi:MAG TPA: TetR/AcrR family transcriptional regulator [Nocardioides sp.]|uniref:TetR/AcrR family transcriptional regulator n=1 Tax=Nocardioides sp. TaxID=35761 RepID=UPI002E329CF1|nr:TetR/AcrR family transcriptional regulator [Nocardioides sp.]HEX5086607.1 TetR/AcrR family transcriptional regulator [Nocardioides sp.]